MAMTLNTRGGMMSSLNVTPLIDVLLVLLIIFMVIAPSRSAGLDATVPQIPKDMATNAEPSRAIVVQIDRNLAVTINGQAIDRTRLAERLTEIFKLRSERVVFLKADGDLEFQEVATAIDAIRSAGIDQICLL